ncbi:MULTISPECIES: aminoacyl-tRNA hydrolase [unclassified Mesorhizobium]|uniref:aminoacyl-tRNA hydrolase n=1 Tax=unclassified Mesorhizobium TaxID=325217 RepID=UPI001129C1CB|nr:MULTISPECIES: aminoacyl-tRNA hydrolase [unclassified Mesorhizobium]MBZ9958913.1 aminoacyl-tRNA hydrolase [Mesorhizobium sp. BR1-1-14]MCA0024962.1 aminoacyl-tRNA hydrolase [Mesorhizobium sp. B263B1A]TPJ94196.1 aminoacyl-tRNA hydrolase [Mesorhizobium sp. B2-5-12]TPK25786.1 aminoacyl-tRNA hydrolase [Mesorhizobium sp. B2-5-6]TPK68824.1 aminoacyl-tRNA hydrolase [Mesorhizobium sp. B2-5-1]
MPLVFAGLGNPGAKYAANRHNVGFMAVDAIARRHSFSPWSKKFQGLIADGTLGGEKIILIKPQTFMNLSGQSVGEALRFYKLGPGALTVFYDEIDLAEGKLRIKTGGGAGGHNGIRSIDGHVGNAYRRVRIGVGHPGVKEMVQHHVLGDFGKTDRDWLDPLLDAVADNAAMIVKGDESGFMNKAALAVQGKAGVEPEKPAPKQQSHIRQARPQQAPAKLPESGPMAAMLKKLFGNKD